MRHLVWDMGGTLIDTYPSVDRTLADVCRAAGHPVALAEVSRLTRRSIADAGEELARRCGVPADRFTEAYAALKRAWLSDPPPVMSGARDLLATVTAAGGLNLVVTHRDRTSAEDLLRVHGLVVDELICAPDGHPRKPDPAMYHLGIRRRRLDPADCLAVGDRAIDAEAARAAGLAWALLETPGIPVPLDGGLHIRSLTELLPLVDGSATRPRPC